MGEPAGVGTNTAPPEERLVYDDRVAPDLVGHLVGARADRFPAVGRFRQMFGGPSQQLRETWKHCNR
jgi:hypothetical protein